MTDLCDRMLSCLGRTAYMQEDFKLSEIYFSLQESCRSLLSDQVVQGGVYASQSWCVGMCTHTGTSRLLCPITMGLQGGMQKKYKIVIIFNNGFYRSALFWLLFLHLHSAWSLRWRNSWVFQQSEPFTFKCQPGACRRSRQESLQSLAETI